MMDTDGLPVACDLYPGNESEQPTLILLEERLESQFGLSQVYRLYRCRALERGQAYLQQQRQAPVRVHGVLEEPKEGDQGLGTRSFRLVIHSSGRYL